MIEIYEFGYDLDNIQEVMDYLIENYKGNTSQNNLDVKNPDYLMWIGIGHDVMNALEVYSESILEDEKFLELMSKCEPGQ
jgi:hypothetical protein